MFAPTLDWLYWTIGGVLALVAIVFAWRAVFRDRARGRFRCPKCWYDLTAPEGAAPVLPVTCSECGRVTREARRLDRTRRRWGRVVVALVMVGASCAIAVYPSVHRNGWASLVPTWFIVDTMPVFGYPTALTRELVRRDGHTSQGLDSTGHVYLLNRVAKGSPVARPGSARWRDSYGAFAIGDGCFFFTDYDIPFDDPKRAAISAAVEEIQRLPPHFALRTRPVWPEHIPLYIEEDARHWPLFNISLMRQVTFEGLREWWIISEMKGLLIGTDRLRSAGVLTIRAKIDKHVFALTPDGKRVSEKYDRVVEVPYVIRGTIDELITPVVDPALDGLVASIRYRINENGYPQRWVESTCTSGTRDIGFGVIMEHIHDGETRAIERVWWQGGLPLHTNARVPLRNEWVTRERFQGVSQSGGGLRPKPGENWTVRIRSDPETALRVIDADKYWQGDVTIPLTIR
jgi:hypothetical protein